MSDIIPLFKVEKISKFINKRTGDLQNQQVAILHYIGEEFINKARYTNTYSDRTGNLRSSIGYTIIKNGEVFSENILLSQKGTDKHTGLNTAKEFIVKFTKDIITKISNTVLKKSVLLVLFAGMEYAATVEKEHGLDVISGSVPEKSYIKKFLKEIDLK